MTAPSRLAVTLAGEHVADVERIRGRLRLTYTVAGTRPGTTPLSLSLPRERGAFTGDVVETYLRGLLPESPAAIEALRATYGVDPNDPLDALGAIGRDCAGAVQFCDADALDGPRADGDLRLATSSDIEGRLASMRSGNDSSWTMPGEHWSLGGMQDKLALRHEDGRWFWAHGDEPTTHIVKPGVRGATAQALIEHITMRAAAMLGCDVATTAFADFASERAIVIERFDRARGADGRLVRTHAEDVCQALGVREKYEELGGPAAATVARFLRDAAETAREARANVAGFVDAVVLNTVLAAPGAHARNYSVLLDGDSVRLAPLYDVATALAYTPHQGDARPVAMSVGGCADAARIDREHWMRFADDVGVAAETVLDRVAEVRELAPRAFVVALDEIEDDWDGQAADVRSRLKAGLDAPPDRG